MAQMKAEKFQAKKVIKRSQFLDSLIINLLTTLTCFLLCSYPYWYPYFCSSMEHLVFIILPHICSSLSNPKCLFIVVNIIVAFLVGESKLLDPPSSNSAGEIYEEYIKRRQNIKGVSTYQVQERREDKKVVKTRQEMSITKGDNEEKQRVHAKANSEEKALVKAKEKGHIVSITKGCNNEEKQRLNGGEKALVKAKEKGHVMSIFKGDNQEKQRLYGKANNEEKALVKAKEKWRIKGGDEDEEFGLPAEELNKRAEEFIARVNRRRWHEAKLYLCSKA